VSGDGVVLIVGGLFLIFVAVDDFQVVGSEFFSIYFLDAIDEFDGSGVSVLGKERDGDISCFDGF
jgi:hypothetical protein